MIKNWLRNILPAYKAGNTILASLKETNEKIYKLSRRIDCIDKKNEYLFFCLQRMGEESETETRKRVLSQLPKADGGLRIIQLEEAKILCSLKEICDANGLRFSLAAGSLIGAIRHKGFIPWDDDIDIDMMRDDYDKLEKILEDDPNLMLKRYYKCYAEDYNGAGYVAKIKRRDNDDFYVDIFPFDRVATHVHDINGTWEKTVVFCDDFHRELTELFKKHGFVYPGHCRPERFDELDADVKALEQKYVKAYHDLNKNSSVKATEYICYGFEVEYVLRARYKLQEKKMYLPYVENSVSFEDNLYCAYNNPEKWLANEYGDIWQLPKSIEMKHCTEYKELTEYH